MFDHITSLFVVCLFGVAFASTLPHRAVAVDSQEVHDAIEAIAAYDFKTARTLYDVIKVNGHLDACAFLLASSMKKAMLSTEFDILSSESKAEFEILKEQLPISVKNAVFANAVCFKNLSFDEYLFSPNNDYLHDSKSRHVFMWRLGGIVAGSNWTMVPTLTPTDFKLTNIFGEYLFADNSHTYLNRRNVYSYIPTEWTGVSSNVWRFITVGDDVILQNTWYAGSSSDKEYLYGSANIYNYDENRRTPFSWDKSWGSDNDHMWRVDSC